MYRKLGMTDRTPWAWTAAIVGGAVLWLVAAAVSGKREAWDSSLYWTVAYPLGIGLAGALGYWAPEGPWRWGLALMWAQALVMIASASDFGLLPLGLVMFSILALPAIGVATLVAKVGLRARRS
jgi:peptidoglycan/LPS O-acetylase OafA/YrhL